jgi:propionyl-CoA carboxylase alpha chain
MSIGKVLVANRGEIARRVFRTCREMGIATVAVHSDPDSGEPHVRDADETVHLPGAAAAETYLNLDAIIAGAKSTGADAIHPGYGFLSESAVFARAVVAAGITWIGPPPDAIEVMGSKIASKRIAEEADVATLPSVELAGLSSIQSAALSIGYPVLVKASAGGGGKGMRLVDDPDLLGDAIDAARREAASSFDDDSLLLEKYLPSPRHIEIQIFGDSHGNLVSMFERECSIQRRHQKIIEESPSPAVDDRLRRAMGRAAVAVARAVGYVGAGTVEFLHQTDDFYFLEMNTRLQVEHPVTEMVTGLDLVKLQIDVASGHPLPKKAMAPTLGGHAIEARIYAEDPGNDFLPVTGRVHRFHFEPSSDVRIETGVDEDSEVAIHYDPMLAKVISHAPDRMTAAAKLATALRTASIHMTTNVPLLTRILEDERFLSGDISTGFLDDAGPDFVAAAMLDDSQEELAAIAAALADQAERRRGARVLSSMPSGWRNVRSVAQTSAYEGRHSTHEIRYVAEADGFSLPDNYGYRVVDASPDTVEIEAGEDTETYQVSRYGTTRYVNSFSGQARLEAVPRFPEPASDEDAGSLHAPMPGRVLRLDVAVGVDVAEGQTLLVMEAMKMEHTLKATHAGQVTAVNCREGDQVEGGTVLVVIG